MLVKTDLAFCALVAAVTALGFVALYHGRFDWVGLLLMLDGLVLIAWGRRVK